MNDAERRVIELAAALPCADCGTEDEPCKDPNCVPCHAAILLPDLRCACNAVVLPRSAPVVCTLGTKHTPAACGPIELVPSICRTCRQPIREAP